MPFVRLAAILLLACLLSSGVHAGNPIHRIGMLETRSRALNAANVNAFLQGLQDLGYREHENYEIVYRDSEGHDRRFPALARELVDQHVDVILTRGTPAALAAKNATHTIPIVMAASADPVGTGIVASLAHPDANVTGMSSGITDAYGKRVELLHDLIPGLARIAALFNMANPVIPPQWRTVEKTARSLGIEPQLLDIRRPEDLSAAFQAAAAQHAEALIVGLDGVTQSHLKPIADAALRQHLPSIYAEQSYAKLGGLVAYGASDAHLYRRAAAYVDRIFKGAKPAELPVEQPTEVELVINQRTARALGVAIPPELLLRADEIIE